ncbi:PAS domain S-box protein [Desulfogranum japonicum]|uniref:PAS domain S-box protein n=1 Tax=Desulfogranum japonicum TaxID=231447 RepID=UPI000428DFBA|nr:PAS domain S-box protein [Desulfogranum japonicum]
MQKNIDTRDSHNSSFDFTGPINQWPQEIQAVFFRFSVEVAADEVFWMRDDSKLLYVNDSACRRLGYSREELLQMYVWDWDPLFSKELWYDFLRDINEKKTLFFETQHRTKSGAVFPVEISSHVLTYEGQNYIFAFVTDISERRKTEDELENHRNHLEGLVKKRTKELENTLMELKAAQAEILHSQKLQAIGKLAAGIAHEINTPSQYVGNNLSFIHDSFTDLLQAMASCRALLVDSQEELSVQDFRYKLEQIIEISDLDFLTEEVPQALAACEDGIGRITTM